MRVVTALQIIAIHDFVIRKTGGMGGVRDYGRIESVVAGQTQHVFGHETFPTLLHKGAAILRSIICDHPFLDGNKRTGVLSAIVFLSLNNIVFATEITEIENFAVLVATKKLAIEDIVAWLKDNTVPEIPSI